MTPLVALRAYTAATGGASAPTQALSAAGHSSGSSFSDVLRSAMTDAVQASRQAETQMTNQVHGRAQLVDVVTAVANAETSLETVMAVRDQMINAYQEVMRMPI